MADMEEEVGEEGAETKAPKAKKSSKKQKPKVKKKKPATSNATKQKRKNTIKKIWYTSIRALPLVGMVVLLLGAALFVWELFHRGELEGEVAYKSGRYAIANIGTGQIQGNLLPPPVAIPSALLVDVDTKVSNPELQIPVVSVPEEDIKLRPAPNMALVEEVDERILPKKSADGEVEPWQYYARPYTPAQGTKPISVIVTGLGVDSDLSLAATQLPASISFGISVYAQNPNTWIKSMRVQGHECYLSLPVELSNYPLSDPGPKALQPSITPKENMERLEWLLGQGIGYVGFVVPADEVFFAAQADFIEPVAKELADRGISLLFSQAKERPALKEMLDKTELVYTQSHVFIRYGSDAAQISQQLEAAEAVAERGGHSLVVIEASPIAIQELSKWAAQIRSEGFQIVPASALARRLFS